MASLDSSFEADLREAIMNDVETRLEDLVENFVEVVHANLRAYGQRHGYNVKPAIDSVSDVQVDRSDGEISVRVGWADEQMSRWEFGVSPHEIDGDPLLSFVWSDPPAWVKEEFDQARGSGGQFESGWRVFFESVDHPGLPEARAIRDAMNGLRRVLRS